MTPKECLDRFMAAVRDARAGRNGKAHALIAAVRERNGSAAAEIARRELRNYVDSEKKA
ncbi:MULTISPECIES: hypothetical protein [Burkholderia cepacia complex]|uniref:hypothetical protein n=1 Tax=Burkholderia cepacia complex TaxID=87882 RepID=UPI000AD50EB7|nr:MULTISPECIES: hypothetical protein [Burkholderia cepacia complex]MEB2544054.1 hypothetical protein [Burkholderia cenocepacia]DAH71649.1 MAG TPA: hypothetical protein [Caudoviricetes sp.]